MKKNEIRLISWLAVLMLIVGAGFLVWLDLFGSLRTGGSVLPAEIRKTARRGLATDPLITPAEEVYRSLVTENDVWRGKKEASVVVLEFGNFNNPQSRAMNRLWLKIWPDYENKIKLVWKDFVPPSDLMGRQAAIVARCAQQQGKFWEFYGYLSRQPAADKLTEEMIMSAVKEDGLNGDLFKRCLADKQKVMPLIGDGLSAAQSLGAEETPYLLVGGEPVKGLVDETALRLVLDKQLNKK